MNLINIFQQLFLGSHQEDYHLGVMSNKENFLAGATLITKYDLLCVELLNNTNVQATYITQK